MIDPTRTTRHSAEKNLQAWLAGAGAEVEYEPGARPGQYVVQLPGEAKLRTTVSLLLSGLGSASN